MVALELVVAAILLSVLGLVAISIYLKRSTKNDETERPAGRPAPRDVQRRAQLQRNRGARMRANAARQNEVEVDEEVRPHEPIADVDEEGHKIGAKKKAKLEAKAEKRAQREADEHTREERRKKDKVAEEERKKQDEKERAEEKRREEEERKLKEEKERKEHDEYLRMKAAFLVEEEGFEEGDGGDEQNLLQDFVNYVKQNKVVVIEDLAAHFKLKTQSAIDRIKDLQKDDILTGIIDDRGKFIYVSEEELHAIAKFIKQRGRVSLTELAENSSQLINLAPGAVS